MSLATMIEVKSAVPYVLFGSFLAELARERTAMFICRVIPQLVISKLCYHGKRKKMEFEG